MTKTKRNKMKSFLQSLFLSNVLFYSFILILLGFVTAYFIPFLYNAMWYVLWIWLSFIGIDFLLLYLPQKTLTAKRFTPEKLSNGDDNDIFISIQNHYTFTIYTKVIDEIPAWFQKRDFSVKRTIDALKNDDFKYIIRPTKRGEYHFGSLHIFVNSPIRLIARRFSFQNNQMVPSYPSYIQLKKYDLIAFSNTLHQYGLKKIRRIGHTLEFEQIKEYVLGDDIRTINWNATAKRSELMVNQYQDEKSQNVYMIIDKGRVMRMPFQGLSLLDYAINATLVLSNVILKKQDKAGMFTFSKKVENRIVAEKRQNQMQLLLENLYNIKTDFFESDYSRLYADIKKNINQRSLIILFTNFETLDGLNRQIPYLKGIAKNHLLVVVFFANTELHQLIKQKAKNVQQIYDKVIAEKLAFEKRLVVNELKKYGIYSVLTQPENLTLDVLNKYLEIKARGMI